MAGEVRYGLVWALSDSIPAWKGWLNAARLELVADGDALKKFRACPGVNNGVIRYSPNLVGLPGLGDQIGGQAVTPIWGRSLSSGDVRWEDPLSIADLVTAVAVDPYSWNNYCADVYLMRPSQPDVLDWVRYEPGVEKPMLLVSAPLGMIMGWTWHDMMRKIGF